LGEDGNELADLLKAVKADVNSLGVGWFDAFGEAEKMLDVALKGRVVVTIQAEGEELVFFGEKRGSQFDRGGFDAAGSVGVVWGGFFELEEEAEILVVEI